MEMMLAKNESGHMIFMTKRFGEWVIETVRVKNREDGGYVIIGGQKCLVG